MLEIATPQVTAEYRSGADFPLPLDEPVLVTVTPALAEAWLTDMKYADQRALSQEAVDRIATLMKRGKFSQRTYIRIANLNGQRLLLDGQHRLWAVFDSGVPTTFVVVEESAKTDEDVAWIYGNIDIGKRRSKAELFGPLHLPDEFGLSRGDVESLGSAIAFMVGGCVKFRDRDTPLPTDLLLERMRLYAPYARQYVGLLDGCLARVRKGAMRAPTLSVAMLTLRYSLPLALKSNAPDVLDFWRGAALDDGLTLTDPRKFVHRHFVSTRLSRTHLSEGVVAVSPSYSSRFLAYCFNVYMKGRELKQPKVYDDRAPIQLYGATSDPNVWWEA
jgi:hypothetical protein